MIGFETPEVEDEPPPTDLGEHGRLTLTPGGPRVRTAEDFTAVLPGPQAHNRIPATLADALRSVGLYSPKSGRLRARRRRLADAITSRQGVRDAK